MKFLKNLFKFSVRSLSFAAPHSSLYPSFDNLNLSITKCKEIASEGVTVVLFSEENEDLITAHALYNYVLMPFIPDSDKVPLLYDHLRQSAGNALSFREIIRKTEIKSHVTAKEYVRRFISSGLFFSIEDRENSSKRFLLPYYYKGNNERLLAVRHLLSLGYSVKTITLKDSSYALYATLNSHTLAICFLSENVLDNFIFIGEVESRVIITSGERIVNFSGIKSQTLAEFTATFEFH